MATTIPPTEQQAVQVTPDTLHNDIANALQLVTAARDAGVPPDLEAIEARLSSALAKLDGRLAVDPCGHCDATGTLPGTDDACIVCGGRGVQERIGSMGRPRYLSLTDGLSAQDCGCADLLVTRTVPGISAQMFILRTDLARMAAFARGEEV